VNAGKTVLALESEENAHLIGLGARPVQPDGIDCLAER